MTVLDRGGILPLMSLIRPVPLIVAILVANAAAAADNDWSEVEAALGRKGSMQPGQVYKFGLPRNDLDVALDGVAIRPALALGSWLAFKQVNDHALVMGDLVLVENEVGPVMERLATGDIMVTAVHHHLLRARPLPMYMHVMGEGDAVTLAETLRAALAASKTPLDDTPGTSAPAIDLDTAALERALGHKGKANGGVYQFGIPRAEAIKLADVTIPPSMGTGSAINFQAAGDRKAAITGDFVLTAREVNPVLRTLRENGIEVTALHNHMLAEEPRLFFMHFWAVDDAETLAKGLRAALVQTNSIMAAHKRITFDDVAAGPLPQGWKIAATNPRGALGRWAVVADRGAGSPPHVLSLTEIEDHSSGHFNLAWTPDIRFQNGEIEVAVRADSGRTDQGGGPIWRAHDPDNYYVARYNPLERNFRLYYVKDARRHELASASGLDIEAGQWLTIRIVHQGSHIEGWIDGKKLVEVDDSTFPDAGGVGVWTKADAATAFDNLEIRAGD